MSFGEYFRKLRESKNKTQKEIADCIGKSAMLISGVEKGKNGPFNTEDLKKIARYLELTKDEEESIMIEAAIERGVIPEYLVEYMSRVRKAYSLLLLLRNNKYTDKDISELIKHLEEK